MALKKEVQLLRQTLNAQRCIKCVEKEQKEQIIEEEVSVMDNSADAEQKRDKTETEE